MSGNPKLIQRLYDRACRAMGQAPESGVKQGWKVACIEAALSRAASASEAKAQEKPTGKICSCVRDVIGSPWDCGLDRVALYRFGGTKSALKRCTACRGTGSLDPQPACPPSTPLPDLALLLSGEREALGGIPKSYEPAGLRAVLPLAESQQTGRLVVAFAVQANGVIHRFAMEPDDAGTLVRLIDEAMRKDSKRQATKDAR